MTDIYEIDFNSFLLREIFNVCLIGALILFAAFLLSKMREKEPGSAQRKIYLGYCLFLLSYACTRVFFIFSDLEVYSTESAGTLLNTVYVGIAYSFGIFGALWLIVMLERFLLHTRYIFTVIGIIMLILSLLSIFIMALNTIIQFAITITLPAFFLLVVVLYLYIAIKSAGEARKRSLGIIAGLVIMMAGFLFG
ncbi:MAG: hypothetical protein LUQ65_00005, partial [Candidatus Helarchaeota archaeon]|nr:hypothetical protein [Candidatus Helarchaeota archaeon]